MSPPPGAVVLFGSGETSASGRQAWDWALRRLNRPVAISVLETPAGFQPNSELVASKVGEFIRQRLPHHQPQVSIVPARQRGTLFSPDDPAVVAPLLHSTAIFLGPGSPTYAVRQLRDSLAWHILLARHRLGASIVMASAATIAAGAQTLPVYEIYKSGDDLHWCPGLDFLRPYGLPLVLVSHWDNNEGGAELDTSRCFMGQDRFARLRAMLPSDALIVGIDEHTALMLDLEAGVCRVMGRGGVTLVHGTAERAIAHGESFPITELGPFQQPAPETGISAEVWQLAQRAQVEEKPASGPPAEVLVLVQEREAARARRDWPAADVLRAQITALGWQVRDTPQGPELAAL